MDGTQNLPATVGELIRETLQLARISGESGIDNCCGTEVTPTAVVGKRRQDPDEAFPVLEPSSFHSDGACVDLEEMISAGLEDTVFCTHHESLREELKRLDNLVQHADSAHGQDDPLLLEIRQKFPILRAEIFLHMEFVEELLFRMRHCQTSGDIMRELNYRSIMDSIDQLEQQHGNFTSNLGKFKKLSVGNNPPESACTCYDVLHEAFETFEKSMQQYLVLEASVLKKLAQIYFPEQKSSS